MLKARSTPWIPLLVMAAACFAQPSGHTTSGDLVVKDASGLRLLVAPENASPTLRLILPGGVESDRTIEIIFPEHVTARKRGESEGEHLYRFRPGPMGTRPGWHRSGQSLEYEKELPGDIHMVARATLQSDGVRFHYEFRNASNTAYDMIYAVTDPRLTGEFHDVRLERTFVHHPNGFELLASETPERLEMPLDQWLPARYLASFTWPIPAQRVERRADGVTYYTKSRAVDTPFIATTSTNREWVIASFTSQTGNVWSNPELTCQHVDPQQPLPPKSNVTLEVKLLAVHDSLEGAFRRASEQRALLR